MTGVGTAPARVAAPIPFAAMDGRDPRLMRELMAAVESVASRAAFTLGDEVDGFERDFALYCGADHAVGVSSGTDALLLCLRALGVGRGDEVIVPANSFVATAEAVALTGAKPRLVDVDPETHTITGEIVGGAWSSRTRAVIPVHLYGRTADVAPIVELARSHGAAVIEDACQAHGAMYRGRRVGTIADAGCFSFYPAKNLGAWGDAGAVVTSDRGLAERVALLRSHGEGPRHRHSVCGTTARMDGIQAAILRVKLARLDVSNERRRRVAAEYAAVLNEQLLTLPAPAAPDHDHVFHLFVIEADQRDRLRHHLEEQGIATGVHYPRPIHRQEAFAYLRMPEGSLPTAERLAGRILSLPLHPSMTAETVARVARAVTESGRERASSTALGAA